LQYRLWNLDYVLNKVLFGVLLFAPLIILQTVSVELLASQIGYMQATAISTLFVIYLLIGTPYRRKVQKSVDELVYRGKYDYRRLLSELTHTLVAMLDLESLLNYINRLIIQNLGASRLALFLEEPETERFILQSVHGIESNLVKKYSLSPYEGIIRWLRESKNIFVKERMEKITGPEEFHSLYGDLGKFGAEIVIPLVYKDGLIGILSLDSKLSGATYDQGDIDLLSLFADEAAIAVENARLYVDAITDGMTRLYHKKYFMKRLDEEFDRAKRHGHFLTLMMIDVDLFKSLNDTYGHRAGDAVLKSVAKLMKSRMRTTDILARYGGEEFSAILPETDKVGAMNAAEQIRLAVEESAVEYEEEELSTTISIGITTFEGKDKESNMEDLIKRADKALYDAKKGGRNRVCVF
jgi:diguanylate cyclase (GGDEF)-like protein